MKIRFCWRRTDHTTQYFSTHIYILMKRTIITLILLSVGVAGMVAQQSAPEADPYPDYQEDVFMDMELAQNIVTPEIPKDLRASISAYQKKVAEKLMKNYTVDMMRNDDVFVICIPTDDLFLPNDTLFSIYAAKVIDPVLKLMKDPYMFKILVAVHTDDTGSEQYRQGLSTSRIYTVYDWFMDAIDKGDISEDLVIVPYAMGSSEPLVSNDTRKHRKENRRLEIYFVPGPKMIKLAREKKLK